jgi:PAS domain-containing protein
VFDFLRDDPETTLPELSGAPPSDAHAWRASEAILAAVALIYPLWHWIFLVVMPAARDPLAERLVISLLSGLTIGLSRRGHLHGQVARIEQAMLFVMTAHYLSLVWRNDFAPPYVAGLYVVFACCSVVITSLGLAVLYSLLSLVTVAAMIELLGHSFRAELEWFVGMATVLVALCIGAYRASVLRRATIRRLFLERRLLKLIINAIPDPVFVRNTERDLVLANQAGRDFENATGFDLEPVTRQELSTLETGQSVEADTEVATRFGRMAVSVKTAQAESVDREKMVVTVMRDVTERRTLEDSLRSKIEELQQARERVRQLQGMLPICMHCSRIRTGSDDWETLERYITHHSDASFTHTLCATCLDRHYPD